MEQAADFQVLLEAHELHSDMVRSSVGCLDMLASAQYIFTSPKYAVKASPLHNVRNIIVPAGGSRIYPG